MMVLCGIHLRCTRADGGWTRVLFCKTALVISVDPFVDQLHKRPFLVDCCVSLARYELAGG